MNQEKSCGCIIIKDDKVLVISTEADQHLHGKYSYYGAAWDEAKRRMEKHDV